MEKLIAEKLIREKLISESESTKIRSYFNQKLFSLHWEIKTILYLGVLLLSAGVGFLVYINIDTISHQAILLALALATGACYFYVLKHAHPYSKEEVKSPGLLFDYLLLLGCLLFLSFEGYFQYAYEIFGNRYGLATLIPSVLFFILAYRFDHKGVLSLAITGLATWMGISSSPKDLITGEFEFYEMNLVWTGLGFGVFVGSVSYLLDHNSIKKHFSFTYLNFVSHVLFISTLVGLFMNDNWLMLFFSLLLLGICLTFFYFSKRERSFYFLLLSILYGYIGLTYLIFKGLIELGTEWVSIYFGFFYFIGSCGGLIYLIYNHKKILKYDSLS